MTPAQFDAVAIGNAIVDIIGQCDDAFLTAHGSVKGGMALVDEAAVSSLYADMGPGTEISGGSAANTMVGIASFGGKAGFIGKVADDDFGRVFAHDIKAAGVAFNTPASRGETPTARSLVLVTPDGERTMHTFLGVSPELSGSDLDPALLTTARTVYLEGYLFDRPAAKTAFTEAAATAKAAGGKVALTLSDAFCVDRHRDEFLALIDGHIDILFANEAEILSLYQVSAFEAAFERVKQRGGITALTRSEKGCVLISGRDVAEVPAFPVAKVVDTTGAGDLFAAGTLFGLARGLDLAECGTLGCLAAAEVISHIGARPQTSLAALAAKHLPAAFSV